MAKIKFTSALKQFFPDLKEMEVCENTVLEALKVVGNKYPGMMDYILDERGTLRQHMNIFIQGELIKDRETLQDALQENDEILIFQALSGG